jgi:phosphomannomutase
MKINPTIFKAYDIRGIYPSELNEQAAFCIGKAFGRYTKAKNMVICHDARISCPELKKGFLEGFSLDGGKIYDIGQLPTECLYFAVGFYDFSAGVMITASHNPKEYNGFKMIKKSENGNIEIIRGKDLLPVVESKNLEKEENAQNKNIEIIKKDILKDYINHILSFVDLSEISPLKVVVDASNGVAGKIILEIKDKLPIEIIELNFESDGNFPNHSPNPLAQGSAEQISKAVKEQKADFGLMFDGDADRIFLVDETGELVKADVALLLLARHFLKKNSGMAVAYNAICSKATPEFIKKWGGNPIRTQVGFVNVRNGMLENNGIMGGELSGHYCFRDNYYLDSGMIAMLVLLQVISNDNRKVSEIVKELSPYAKSAEMSFEVENKDKVLEEIRQKYADGKQDFLDGITVEYKNWWFNARPSNTEPLLRLTIEADTKEILQEKQKELISFISGT